MLNHLLTTHANAVVADGQGARRLVSANPDLQIGVTLQQGRIRQRLKAQLVRRIRRVRDQLAQKDLLVRIQGVDHQLQELFDFRLEAEGFFAAHREFSLE